MTPSTRGRVRALDDRCIIDLAFEGFCEFREGFN